MQIGAWIRVAVGGALMGVANIIPGVSGGTMVLALGIYERFVGAVSNVTRMRWGGESIPFLAVLGVSAVVGIGVALYPIDWGLRNVHHILFALFIGLTLGGVPIVWREMRGVSAGAVAGCAAGFAAMVAMVFFDLGGALPVGWVTFLVAGIIAAAAMVLPGISGSYLLLIFGLYVPLTRGVKDFLSALKDFDMATAVPLAFGVILPTGVGVLLGIVGLANGLTWLLERYRKPTLGVLLGLLLGSVVGLYPFQDLYDKDELIAAAHATSLANLALVVIALAIGGLITWGVGRLGGEPRTIEESVEAG